MRTLSGRQNVFPVLLLRHMLERASVFLTRSHLAVASRAEKEVTSVKRVRSACILQTLVFSQKPELGHSRNVNLKLNRDEFESYKKSMERTGTRYQIIDESEEADGSLVIHVRKQYNGNADVSEYFT